MAIPLKRQLINVEKLPFPRGIATAETLRSLHTSGAAAMAKAHALLGGRHRGALVAFWREGLPAVAGWLAEAVGQRVAGGRSSESMALPEQFPLIAGESGRSN